MKNKFAPIPGRIAAFLNPLNSRLPEYQGVVDCPGSYRKFDNLSHAICNAHILRELKGIRESDPKQARAEDMRALLREMARPP